MKSFSLALMSVVYIFAGAMHFIRPRMYLKIMPPYLPAPLALVYLSGAAEILLGALLWVPETRALAAWGLIALLVAVLPANIFMLQGGEAMYGIPRWILILRLPLQAVLMAWAYWHTKL